MTKETYIKELDKILKRASVIEELEKIREEIEKLEYDDFDCNLVLPAWKVYDIIGNHIEEMKGDK